MKNTRPQVFLVARPEIDTTAMYSYLDDVGGEEWFDERYPGWDGLHPDSETLVEFGGKICYRSWKPGLNPNVTKVRDDRHKYLSNILESGHGSVLEHVSWSFVFQNVSRVFTHELVRHRAGVAISQESMRYVRLTEIPFWVPDWVWSDEVARNIVIDTIEQQENAVKALTEHWGLDTDKSFHNKKVKTSFLRRLVGNGVSTDILWTCNARELRHVIDKRTDASAEEEMRFIFGQVAELMIREAPELFGDFEHQEDGSYKPKFAKV